DHRWHRILHPEDDALHQQPLNALEDPEVEGVRAQGLRGAGVVEDRVDPAEVFRHPLEGRRDLVIRRDVGMDVERAVTERFGEGLPLLVLHVDACDLRAGSVQHVHGTAADAAAAAGDDGDLSLEVDHRSYPPVAAWSGATTSLSSARRRRPGPAPARDMVPPAMPDSASSTVERGTTIVGALAVGPVATGRRCLLSETMATTTLIDDLLKG